VLAGDKVAVVAIYAVVGHAIVDGAGAAATVMHVALGRPAELLGFVEARDAAAATIQIVQLGRCDTWRCC
jgi:hypothetical protein